MWKVGTMMVFAVSLVLSGNAAADDPPEDICLCSWYKDARLDTAEDLAFYAVDVDQDRVGVITGSSPQEGWVMYSGIMFQSMPDPEIRVDEECLADAAEDALGGHIPPDDTAGAVISCIDGIPS